MYDNIFVVSKKAWECNTRSSRVFIKYICKLKKNSKISTVTVLFVSAWCPNFQSSKFRIILWI